MYTGTHMCNVPKSQLYIQGPNLYLLDACLVSENPLYYRQPGLLCTPQNFAQSSKFYLIFFWY
jgi:hypothetical protein